MRSNIWRSCWKPWTWSTRSWVNAIVLLILASPFITRQFCLWQVPDVVVPFDVEAGIDDDVPEDQNAYAIYQDVLRRLANPTSDGARSDVDGSTNDSKGRIDDLLQRLFAHDEKALAEYLRAGSMERAAGPAVRTCTFWTDLDVYQRFRAMVRSYSALAISFEENGEIEKAWEIYRANLQCSIHTEQTHLAICGLIATALRSITAEGIVHWASNSAVTAKKLRAARQDIVNASSRRVPISEFSNGEYLGLRNSMNERQVFDYFLPTGPEGKISSAWLLIGKQIVAWCFAQPELTLRTNRQVLVNNLQEQNKPRHLRRPSVERSGQFIFELDPDARRLPGQLSSEQLTHVLESNSPILRLNRTILPWLSSFEEARGRDSARLVTLIVLFAAQEYQRDHAEFPKSIEELVPKYLTEVPIDPLDGKGRPIQYRREADGTAVVWSIGGNKVDDQGDVDLKKLLDIGYLIKRQPVQVP